MLKKLINYIKAVWKRYKRRRTISKALVQIEKPFQEQLKERIFLHREIKKFLRDFFGVDAQSKYIPKDFKNKEEVRVAIQDKFGSKMQALNINYEDLFK